MNELDALLAEQVAYYRAMASEYLEDAGVEGVTEETQHATARAILAALENAAPLGDVLELGCGPGSFTSELASPRHIRHRTGRIARDARDRRRPQRTSYQRPNSPRPTCSRGPQTVATPSSSSASGSPTCPRNGSPSSGRLASALTPDGRVMFIDDGHRTTEELIDGPESSTIERRLRDGRRFRAVKVPLEPASLERSLQEARLEHRSHATRRPVLPRPRPPRQLAVPAAPLSRGTPAGQIRVIKHNFAERQHRRL